MNYEKVNEIIKTYSVQDIRAAFRAVIPTKGVRIDKPNKIIPYLEGYANEKQEYFLVVTLGTSLKIIDVHEICKGLLDKSLVHPREVFRAALIDSAKSIIIAHNHPSGNNTPSYEDVEVTKMMKAAGKVMGISVLDHVIISGNGYYSFQEQGEL